LSQANDPVAGAPLEVLEQLYYLHDGSGVLGPLKGFKLKEMIENDAVSRASHINSAGAPDWVPILQFAPFSSFFRDAEAGAPGRSPHAAPASKQAYASFWIRLGAYLIDYALTIGLVAVFGALFAIGAVLLVGAEQTEGLLTAHPTAINFIGTIIALTYYAYFAAGPWQATPGKRFCGIYVIRTSGQRVDASFAVLRNLAYLLSALPLFLGFAMIFWTDERKGLHDMVCGSRVVYGKL